MEHDVTKDSLRASLADVSEVLWRVWNPLDLHDVPEALDEYKAYALQIVSIQARAAAEDDVALYLLNVERNDMGLPGDGDRARRVAIAIGRPPQDEAGLT